MSDFEMKHGHVIPFATFRCSCGLICAMGEQLDRNAAMLHEAPHCARFIAVETIEAGMAYFFSLEELPISDALIERLQVSQAN